ncbi:ATP-dependent DNA ligase [Sphingobium sp. DC-2]|uniref:ATP-dependent DNA ligase n=1 Tax=Sphingobium sp. DC-2 TaxID=1303256 RepID=UPI000A52965F|nr:ATP-dependent DNA ligase [Sphingobium sp. DC-2]
MTEASSPGLTLPLPMEARLVTELPPPPGWQYEPKWDGFRAIAGRDGGTADIRSKSGKSLARFFPEIVATLLATSCQRFIVDGELILPTGGVLSFDALQQRLHPAESRIERLSRETPAQLMLFDCLALDGEDLGGAPLHARRAALERFHRAEGNDMLLLSPASERLDDAMAWLERSGGALDGIIAKPVDAPYRSGERAMLKQKNHRSADCVVGGFRRTADGKGAASLLLGLYDDDGLLHHVGFTSSFKAGERPALLDRLLPLAGGPGFTGKAPGGPSRWSRGEESAWEPLHARLVAEVVYDQVTAGRFRHGTRFLRWRPDKAPGQCLCEQLQAELRPAELEALIGGASS